jgi:hypothetical protein
MSPHDREHLFKEQNQQHCTDDRQEQIVCHKQSIEFHRRLSLHQIVSTPNGNIVGNDCSHDFRDSTERGVSREKVKVMCWCTHDFFVAFVEDGPEVNAEWTVDGRPWNFVHCQKRCEVRDMSLKGAKLRDRLLHVLGRRSEKGGKSSRVWSVLIRIEPCE